MDLQRAWAFLDQLLGISELEQAMEGEAAFKYHH